MAKTTKRATSQVARKHRTLQRQIEKADRRAPEKEKHGAMQAGARRYPAPPLPRQHQRKPGREAELSPPPMYDAPYYKGSGKLAGKIAIITGADSGIGRAVAVLFAREGADVAALYLNEHADAEETRDAVEDEGGRCLLIAGDVSQSRFCDQAVQDVLDAYGRIDILVNNAAFQLHTANIEDLTDAHFDMTVKTNLYGYFFMARAVIPQLGRGGVILNTGSVTGINGSGPLLDYSMTKGGVHAFTRSLSQHLAPRGIRVNAVAPGPVWTPLNPADKKATEVMDFGKQTEMRRPAQPEEIAPAYVFLASSHTSSYITGEILPIIGGYGS